MLVDLVQETPHRLRGGMEVGVGMEPAFRFLHRAHPTLGIAIRGWFADGGHTDVGSDVSHGVNRRRPGVLNALVGMMDRGPMLRQRPAQGGSGQRLIQGAAEMPAADAARIDRHSHRQVDERLRYADGRDLRAPHVVGADHRQPLHQVLVAGVDVMAARRPGTGRRAVALQPHDAHEARPRLVVHLEVFAAPEGRDSPVAIGRPLPRQPREGGVECRLIAGVSLVVRVTPGIAQHTADMAHSILMAEHPDDLPLGLDRWCTMLVACLRRSFSSVKRPSSRSSAATCGASWPRRCSELSNAAGACLRKMAFPSAKTEAASWCSRHNSARLLAPDRSSRTTWAFNSAVNWR